MQSVTGKITGGDVSSFFQFSDDIRRIMYTTNIIEGLNRQYRKVTKTKSVFPSDSSLEKMLYLASGNVIKKWTQRYRNWDQVPGTEPADRPLWGKAHTVPVKGKAGTFLSDSKMSRPYSIGISSTARKSQSYSGGRVWAEPTDHLPAADA